MNRCKVFFAIAVLAALAVTTTSAALNSFLSSAKGRPQTAEKTAIANSTKKIEDVIHRQWLRA